MSPPLDPEYEARLLATIREPLLEAVGTADARSSASAGRRRLVAAVGVGALIAAGAVGVWRASGRDEPGPTVRVAPTSSPSTVPGPLDVCAGTRLTVVGTGEASSEGALGWYVDLRNDAPYSCAVPYPTAATARDATSRRVGLAGIDHIAGPGPQVSAGATTRLVLSTADACSPGNRPPDMHFRSLVVTIGGAALAAPGIELVLCTQGVGALTFEAAPTAPPRDPRRIDLGDGRSVRVEHDAISVGSGVGNGKAETPDHGYLAYEYAAASGREVALVDTEKCATGTCVETRIGRGHSPTLAADGTLAYVVPDSNALAAWRTSGAITVRTPSGTSAVWARGWGFQTVAWVGTTLIVAHDVDAAESERFEEVYLYRGPGDRTLLPGGLVAISPDGRRLLLGGRDDIVLQLYDVASDRVVASISNLDYQRALVPESELVGVDLSWPGHDELQSWPVSCCAYFTGHSLWHDDLVLFPNTRHVTHRAADGYPDRSQWAPTLVQIDGDRILPLRFLRVVGFGDGGHAERWLPGSTTDFVLQSSDSSSIIRTMHCRIARDRARCAEDPSLEPVFGIPVMPVP